MTDTRDRGVVLPLMVFSLLALLIVVAIVIDLGATRAVRISTRSAADSGATAGALGLVDGTSTLQPCRDAFAYTYENLGGTQPSDSSITSACAPLSDVCAAGSPRTASLTVDGVTVSVTNPVVAGSALMRAVAVGGGSSQSLDPTVDGTDCQRLGVVVTRSQSRFFGGVAGGGSGAFTIHSVARSSPPSGSGEIAPALVTLHQTMRCSIDAGSGKIVLKATSGQPGVAFSDSDGTSGCGSPAPYILVSRNTASRLIAESAGATPGILGWFAAPTTVGYDTGASVSATGTEATAASRYTGVLLQRAKRITRNPADLLYNCSGIVPAPPSCGGSNFVSDNESLAQPAAVRPAGYALYTAPLPCSTEAAPITLLPGDWWIDCPLGFTVKGNPLIIAGGGTVVFRGPLSVEAGGTLAVNVTNPISPNLDAAGRPIAAVPSRQTVLVLAGTGSNSLSLSSASALAYMAQTAIYSRGAGTISASLTLRWTAPSDGPAKNLLWWSESTQPWTLSGSPVMPARGIFFHGRGALTNSGGGTIDLTNVQVWASSANNSGGGTIRLAPDPDASIKTEGGGTALVR